MRERKPPKFVYAAWAYHRGIYLLCGMHRRAMDQVKRWRAVGIKARVVRYAPQVSDNQVKP